MQALLIGLTDDHALASFVVHDETEKAPRTSDVRQQDSTLCIS